MTSKELLYVEDALSHEAYMKTCCKKTGSQLTDPTLASYISELQKKHGNLTVN